MVTSTPSPVLLYQAVAQYNQTQIAEQNRRARTGLRVLSSIITSTRLRILRDLASHLCADRSITGWAEVTTTDLENFLTPTPTARYQRTYVLRRYFAWAKAHKHVLVDPARPLRLGAQPAFTGLVLEVNTRRTLFRAGQIRPHRRRNGRDAAAAGSGAQPGSQRDRGQGAVHRVRREMGPKYPAIVRLWESAWSEFVPFLDYDPEIRRVICDGCNRQVSTVKQDSSLRTFRGRFRASCGRPGSVVRAGRQATAQRCVLTAESAPYDPLDRPRKAAVAV